MKFSDQIDKYINSDWKDKYIPYNELKNFLSQKRIELTNKTNISNDLEEPFLLHNENVDFEVEFLKILDERIQAVSEFFHNEFKLLSEHLDGISKELKASQDLSGFKNESSFITKQVLFQREHIAHAILKCWEYADQLDHYVQLNILIICRLLKKKDKYLQTDNANANFSAINEVVSTLKIPEKFNQRIIDLYSDSIKYTSKTPIENVTELNAIVEKRFLLKNESFIGFDWVSFFFGTCFIGCLNLLLIVIFPSKAFNYELFLKYFPVFRISLVLTLIFTGAGLAVTCFERWNINYKFLLNIDTRCPVSSKLLFAVSQYLFTIWMIGFGIFLMSLKFHIVSSETWLVVIALTILKAQLFILFVPSNKLGWVYRNKLLKSVLSTLSTGCFCQEKITFTHNIIADILTSLTKPIIDIHYMLLILPRTAFRLTWLENYWWNLDTISIILLTALPNYIRICQCYSRFRNEESGQLLQLINIGKYISGLSIIAFSQFQWGKLDTSFCLGHIIFVFICVVAALYNFSWDLYMDWGLIEENRFLIRSRMLYPKWVYPMIATFDLFGRCTWAITLIPFEPIQNHQLYISLVIFFITVFEIFRRTLWIILRFEHEHLTNTSHFRAMLWVPPLKKL